MPRIVHSWKRDGKAQVLAFRDKPLWSPSLSENVTESSISVSNTEQGKQRLWFTLNRERYTNDNYRSELIGKVGGVNYEMAYGVQYNADFTLILPNDWEADNLHEIIFQIHHVPDIAEENQPGQAPFSIRVTDNNIYLQYCYSTAGTSWSGNNQVCITSDQLAQARAGSSYRFHLELTFSRGILGVGRIRAVIDDVLKFSYDGPFCYDDLVGGYAKFGIYKAVWKTEHNKDSSTNMRHYCFEDMKVTVA